MFTRSHPSSGGGPITLAATALVALTAVACGAGQSGADASHVTPVYDRQTGKLLELRADQDGDGTADTRVYMDGSLAIRAEIDRDGDGRTERWERYGPSGEIESIALSGAGDGVPDTWIHRSTDGTVSSIERSMRGDGKVSRTEFYRNGNLHRVEEDTNGDAQVDRWEEYADDRLVSVSFAPGDSDGRVVEVVYEPDGKAVRIAPREGHDGSR